MSRCPAIRIPTRHRCSSVARWRRRTIRRLSRSAGRMGPRSARSRSIRTARGRRNSSVPRPRCPCSNYRRASWCHRCRIRCNMCPAGTFRRKRSTARPPPPLRCHHGRPNRHRRQHLSRRQPRWRLPRPKRARRPRPRMRTCRPAHPSQRRLPHLLCPWCRHRCRRCHRPPRLGRHLLRYRSLRCTSPGRMSRPRPSVRQSCCTLRAPLRSLGSRSRRPSLRSCSPWLLKSRDRALVVPFTRKPRPDPQCKSRCAFSGCRQRGLTDVASRAARGTCGTSLRSWPTASPMPVAIAATMSRVEPRRTTPSKQPHSGYDARHFTSSDTKRRRGSAPIVSSLWNREARVAATARNLLRRCRMPLPRWDHYDGGATAMSHRRRFLAALAASALALSGCSGGKGQSADSGSGGTDAGTDLRADAAAGSGGTGGGGVGAGGAASGGAGFGGSGTGGTATGGGIGTGGAGGRAGADGGAGGRAAPVPCPATLPTPGSA